MAAMSPQQVLQLIYILYGIVSVQLVLIFFIFWKTPAMTFLKAALLKMPIIYMMGSDHLGFFKTFRPRNGAAHVKGFGLFHITENSHTLEAGSKIPLYFGFRDVAATLFPEYPAIIQEIRGRGIVINNIEDINRYILAIKQGLIENYPIRVKPFTTYKFADLENMFPNNLDPTFIDATVQCEVAKIVKTIKGQQVALIAIVIIIMVGSLGFYMLSRAYKGTITVSDCQAMVASVKSAAGVG
jgi:hypothetical protein